MGTTGKSRLYIAWVLRILLAGVFLIIGGSKLTATLQTREFFASIGWGQWFRYLTGLLDVTGAVLLFVPRWTVWGHSYSLAVREVRV